MDTYPQQHLPSSMLASDTQLDVGLPASSSVGSSQSVSLLLDYDKKNGHTLTCLPSLLPNHPQLPKLPCECLSNQSLLLTLTLNPNH